MELWWIGSQSWWRLLAGENFLQFSDLPKSSFIRGEGAAAWQGFWQQQTLPKTCYEKWIKWEKTIQICSMYCHMGLINPRLNFSHTSLNGPWNVHTVLSEYRMGGGQFMWMFTKSSFKKSRSGHVDTGNSTIFSDPQFWSLNFEVLSKFKNWWSEKLLRIARILHITSKWILKWYVGCIYLCIYSSRVITPLVNSSMYSYVTHRQVKGMVTLNLFIESY